MDFLMTVIERLGNNAVAEAEDLKRLRIIAETLRQENTQSPALRMLDTHIRRVARRLRQPI